MITLYDSVDVSQIPGNASAVAGYVGGKWPTFHELERTFPKAHRLSIAINAGEDADCLDIETGDANPQDAPLWLRRQKARGVKRPVLYIELSRRGELLSILIRAGIKREDYRLWVAHYTNEPHIEPGADATQWTEKGLGRDLDISSCLDSFFDVPHTHETETKPKPTKETKPPTKIDTFQPYDELRWCREWDSLKGKAGLKAKARRVLLKHTMLKRARGIVDKAKTDGGWVKGNRKYRYNQLVGRVDG